MTTHYGQITHLQGRRIFPAPGLVLYGEYLPHGLCRTSMVNETQKFVQFMVNLMMAALIASVMPLPSINRSPAVFCRQVSLNRIVACVHSIWRHYKQRCNPIYVERGYSWIRYGERFIRPQRNQNIMRDTGTTFNGDIRIAHRFCGVAGCRTHSRWARIFCTGAGSLANAINWWNLLCCFYARLTGMQPPALRTVVALAIWGMLKLSGRQWSGWDVWICCLAAILLMDPVAILSQSYGSLPLRSRH